MKSTMHMFLVFAVTIIMIACQDNKGAGTNRKEPDKTVSDRKRPVDYVHPEIGARKPRYIFFSSACRPFGMVNLSPDTKLDSGSWRTGYCYPIDTIRAISHVHAWQMSGIPVMPAVGLEHPEKGIDIARSHFSHDKESIQAGYHQFYLNRWQVNAELTATKRVGFHRYTFPASNEAQLLFDLDRQLGSSAMDGAMIRRISDTKLEGFVVDSATRRRPKQVTIYFAIEFDREADKIRTWADGYVSEEAKLAEGDDCGFCAYFNTEEMQELKMKVAISYTGTEQAWANMKAELPSWEFDKTREEAQDEWNTALSKIEVEGGTQEQKIKFYTDLYHVLLGRRTVSDADGSYIDNTGKEPMVRKVPTGKDGKPAYRHYNSDSFWGMQWTLNIMWPLICPDIANEFVNCFLDYYDNGGMIPRGPSGGNYTFVMTSPTSSQFIASCYAQGIRDYDTEKAWEGMVKNHSPEGIMAKAGYEHDTWKGGGAQYYIDRGYVPLGIEAEAYHVDGAGQTLEYAFADWCLAQYALLTGHEKEAPQYLKRAYNYKNLYDKETGFMRPRMMDGSWKEPFDPHSREGYVEANAYQASWYVPQDVQGLIELMGGPEAFNKRLEEGLTASRELGFADKHDRYKLKINYGNQPNTQAGHLFNYSGAPWLSQKWIRIINEEAFGDATPYRGYNDDEDQGQMGALSALMSMGLFSMTGCANAEPFYEITSPVFDRIVIHLDEKYHPGESFEIIAHNNSKENMYIQKAELNGKPLNKAWFYHKELVGGGKLELWMGPEPNKEWGAGPENAPPSMTDILK